jgi:hypothetical protein
VSILDSLCGEKITLHVGTLLAKLVDGKVTIAEPVMRKARTRIMARSNREMRRAAAGGTIIALLRATDEVAV